MNSEITQWFGPDQTPVRNGWYHTKLQDLSESNFNWWWDGALWRHSQFGYATLFQKRIWRGLAANPAEQKEQP